jgi:hypothetical protein
MPKRSEIRHIFLETFIHIAYSKKKLHEKIDHEITKILRGVPKWQPLETTDLAYYETVIPRSDDVP